MKQLLIAAFFTLALATPAFAQTDPQLGLEQRTTALEDIVMALQADLMALRVDVNTNSAMILTNDGDIFNLNLDVADLDVRVAALEGIPHVKMIDLIASSVSASAEGLVAGDYVLAKDCVDRFNNNVSWCFGAVKSGGATVHVFSWFAGAGFPIPLARSISMAP
jgi:hypothetical protein